MKKKILIQAASILLAVSLTAGCSSSADKADINAASAVSESAAAQTDETVSETAESETEKTEAETSAEENIVEKREDYADGWYSIFRYNSSDKNIISADCFNSDDKRVLAVEYHYNGDEVSRFALGAGSEKVDLNKTYDITRLDNNNATSYSSKIVSTMKDMAEGQELTTLFDDSGNLSEAYYSKTLDDGTLKKTEYWKFSNENLVQYFDGINTVEYSYNDNNQLVKEKSEDSETNYSYEYDDFGNPIKRNAIKTLSNGDENQWSTEYKYWYNENDLPVYTYESTELFGKIYDRLTGSEYDENSLPMRCIIHGEISENYNSILYGVHPFNISTYVYVPNYDGDARIDELCISQNCEN